ncbi:MAG: alpha/beta hydrolase [Rhizobiaceae bacterium]
MRKLVKWLLGAALVLAGAYVGYGSWQVAALVDKILRVGSPIAQGEGAPVPERPEDIGYVGDPDAAFSYPFEIVDLATELGTASAWLIPPDGMTGKRWAIIVHGIGGRRENGYRFLPTLRAADLPVLMMSYRNDEEAPASPNGLYSLGLTEWRDLEAAVSLAGERGGGRVLLVAESMGGGIVGQFLRNSQLANRVDAIVLDAPMVDLPATLSALVGRLGIPLPRTLTQGALWLTTWRYPIDLTDAVVIEDYVAFAGPLFVSHGSGDRIVPVATSDRLVDKRTGPTEYLRPGRTTYCPGRRTPSVTTWRLRHF